MDKRVYEMHADFVFAEILHTEPTQARLYDFNLNYLSVPVDVRLRFPLVYLFAGPELFYHIPSEGIPADF